MERNLNLSLIEYVPLCYHYGIVILSQYYFCQVNQRNITKASIHVGTMVWVVDNARYIPSQQGN